MKNIATVALSLVLAFSVGGTAWGKGKIIHDAEFQLLQEQYGKKWAEEDKEIEKKLESLKKTEKIYPLSSVLCVLSSAFCPLPSVSSNPPRLATDMELAYYLAWILR